MRSALIVATVLCGLGFSVSEASARPVHHRTTVAKVASKHGHKHLKNHSKHRPHGHHHKHK